MEKAIETLRRLLIATALLVSGFYFIVFAGLAYEDEDARLLLGSLGCAVGAFAAYRIINWIFQYGE